MTCQSLYKSMFTSENQNFSLIKISLKIRFIRSALNLNNRFIKIVVKNMENQTTV